MSVIITIIKDQQWCVKQLFTSVAVRRYNNNTIGFLQIATANQCNRSMRYSSRKVWSWKLGLNLAHSVGHYCLAMPHEGHNRLWTDCGWRQ